MQSRNRKAPSQPLHKGPATLAQKVDQLTKPTVIPRSYASIAAAANTNATPLARSILSAQRQAQALRKAIVQADEALPEVTAMTSIDMAKAVNDALGTLAAKGGRSLRDRRDLRHWALAVSPRKRKNVVKTRQSGYRPHNLKIRT